MYKKVFVITLCIAVIAGVLFIYSHSPLESKYYPPCIFKKLTGFDCAGCGSARACYQLLHGNIKSAIDNNILLILMLPVIFVGLINFFLGKMKSVWDKLSRPKIFLAVILLFWVVRNIPVYPFTLLHSDK